MREKILSSVEESIQAIKKLKEKKALDFIEKLSYKIAECFSKEKKIIIAGNGGSLCDGMHFAEELTGFFRKKRRAFPAIVLSEPGHLTCCGNDIGYEYVFSRGVEAFGKKEDIFIALTTSGNSRNLLYALEEAKKRGLITVCFLGKQGGKMAGLADLEWIVDGFSTSDRVQEVHMAAIHIIIEIVEYHLAPKEIVKKMQKVSVEK